MIDAPAVPVSVSYPWYRVWFQVLFRPSTKTFERILEDPKASAWRAVLWVGLSSLLVAAIAAFLNQITMEKYVSRYSTPLILIGLPVLTIIIFLVASGAYHLMAKWMGGTGTYNLMTYAHGTFFAPVYLVSCAFTGMFFLAYLGALFGSFNDMTSGITVGLGALACILVPVILALSIYAAFLTTFAVMAVEKTTTGKAFVAWLVPTMVYFILSRVF